MKTKKAINITLDEDVLTGIDRDRKNVKRSTYINEMLKKCMNL